MGDKRARAGVGKRDKFNNGQRGAVRRSGARGAVAAPPRVSLLLASSSSRDVSRGGSGRAIFAAVIPVLGRAVQVSPKLAAPASLGTRVTKRTHITCVTLSKNVNE